VEDYTFTTKLGGEPIGALWDGIGWDGSNDWEFTSAAGDTPEQPYALWDGTVERSRARLETALADGGLDQLVHVCWPDARHASLRRLLCDLIEEYGRHTGHVDLLREAVDGLVGEDPPAGWHAKGGADYSRAADRRHLSRSDSTSSTASRSVRHADPRLGISTIEWFKNSDAKQASMSTQVFCRCRS
jgi:hypothetical protein